MVLPALDLLVRDSTHLNELANNAKDYALVHGLCMREHGKRYDEDSLTFSPFMLFPTPFPRSVFNNLTELQPVINKLLNKVQQDHEFLAGALKDVIKVDRFTRRLFRIYETVRSEGAVQPVNLGIIRTDYMLDSTGCYGGETSVYCSCKQVEMNTMAVGIALMGTVTSRLHKYTLSCMDGTEDLVQHLPDNDAFDGLVDMMVEAWTLYGVPQARILLVITEVAYLICGRRCIEFEIKRRNPKINITSKKLAEVARDGHLMDDRRLIVDGKEIALMYHRSSFSPAMYTGDVDWDARLMMERSVAIKLPSICLQLAGTKKIQEQPAFPGVLERFCSSEEVEKLRRTFTGFYALDSANARKKASEDPHGYVIKPQREGGMDGIFDKEVLKFLSCDKTTSESKEQSHIMMDRICPPVRRNWLVRPRHSVSPVECTQEFGVFGCFMTDTEGRMVMNKTTGHVLKSKLSDVNEGEITGEVTTAGSDSVYLSDIEKCTNPNCKYANEDS